MRLQDDWFEREQLHCAAADGDVDRMKTLIAAGSDVNAFDELGFTPLHYAAKCESLEAITFLLSVGANVDAQDESKAGNTPLGEVAGTCSLAVAQTLVEAGANPSLPGSMGMSALHRASERKRGEGPAVYEFLRNPGVVAKRRS
jgi:ankyrin repeat protein